MTIANSSRKRTQQGALVPLLAALMLCGALLSGSALAADDQAQQSGQSGPTPATTPSGTTSASNAPLETVTVTGTLIRAPNLQSISPLVTVNAAQLENRAGLNVESYLNTLPQYNPATTPSNGGQFNVQPSPSAAVGISTISLRGFGPNRSLTLIDGHRAVPVDAGMDVDINSIPVSIIERVDTTTGGGTVVYGADAVAGVTNFVLRHDMQGLEIDVQDGEAQVGDDNELIATATMGTKFADNQGSIISAVEYYNRGAAYESNRDFFTNGWADPTTPSGALFLFGENGYSTGFDIPSTTVADLLFNTAARNTGAFGGAEPGVPPFIESLRFNPNGTMYDPNGNNLATYEGPIGASTGYEFAYQNVYDSSVVNGYGSTTPPPVVQTVKYNDVQDLASAPDTRYSFYTHGTYNITDDLQFYADARFANNSTTTFLIPTNASYGWEAQIPYNQTVDSPINPADLNIQMITGVPGGQAALTTAQLTTLTNKIIAAFTADPTDKNGDNPYYNPSYQAPFLANGKPNPLAEHPVPWQLALLLQSRSYPSGPISCNNSIPTTLCTDPPGNPALVPETDSWIAETYPLYSFPQRSTVDTSQDWQIETGFNFPIVADWTGDVYYSRGQSNLYNVGYGDNSLQRWRAIVDAPDYGAGITNLFGNQNGASPGFGTTVPTSCTSGFYNTLFMGDAVPSANCQQAVEATVTYDTQTQQDDAQANFNGSLFTLPAGVINAALGFEYRREAAQFQPDTLLGTNSFLDQVIGVYPLGTMNNSFDDEDEYAEFLVPVVKDLPLIKKVEVDAGVRGSEYSEGFDTTTYRLDLNWEVNDSVRFRGGFNSAVRAPDLGELYLNEQEMFGGGPTFSDPCSLASLAPFGAGGSPLAAQQGANIGTGSNKATTIAPGQTVAGANSAYLICKAQMEQSGDAAYNYYYVSNAPTAPSTGGFDWFNEIGNPNLRPEVAKTWTAGVVLTNLSDSPWLSHLTLAADWYEINLNDAIEFSSIDYANYLCYGAVTVTNMQEAEAQAASPACEDVPRNTATGAAVTQLLQYNNLATIQTSGVDLQVNWLLPLSDVGLPIPGAFTFAENGNWLDYYTTKASPLDFDVPIDWKGSLGPTLAGTDPGAYSYRLTQMFGYMLPSFNINLTWIFLPSVNSAAHAQTAAVEQNNAAVAAGAPGIILGYVPNTDIAAPHYNLINLAATWTVDKYLQIRGGINNLFNTEPAITGASAGFPNNLNVCGNKPGCTNPVSYVLPDDGAGVTNAGFYDIYGRIFFVGFKARF